jgi:hypothetical protein
MIRLWLDDVRPMPDGFDVWVKESFWAKMLIAKRLVSHISFDHDLGEGKTGYDVAKLIEELAYDKELAPMTWDIHSANPVGRKRIEQAMQSAERFWKG